MEIIEYQDQLIKKIKRSLYKLSQSNIDTNKSSLSYFVGWDVSSGLTKIRSQINLKKIFTFFKAYSRDLIGIGYQSNYHITNSKKKKNYKKILITWASKKDFKKDGSLNDIYFKINSKKINNTLWIVIYMDIELPKKLDKNILILKNVKKPNFNLFYFFKIIYKTLIENNFNLKKLLHYSSSHSNFGDIVLNNIKPYLLNKNIKKICMPYEAQPFQQMVIAEVKQYNKKIKVIGYVHDCEPLTPNLIYKKNSPDLLLLPGKKREKYFCKYLNWPKNRLKTTASFRYYKEDFRKILKNQILLPSGIYNIEKISKYFEDFLKNSSNRSLQPIKVRTHPAATNQKLQIKLKSKLEKVINENKNKFSNNLKNKNTTIVIGITSLLIVALENDYKVIQICMDPEIQTYSHFFSPDIESVKISENVMRYKIKKFGGCLKFGSKKNSIKNFMN
ncbi:hypothetical protein OAK00_03160 [Pelagibacteraceae bacterium]|nr:hypothetical protein [Pelagibacteraceae bacterium]